MCRRAMRPLVSPAAKIVQDLSLVFVYGTLKRGLFNSKVTILAPRPPIRRPHLVPPPPRTQRLRARSRRGAAPHSRAHTPAVTPDYLSCHPFYAPRISRSTTIYPSTGTNVATIHNPPAGLESTRTRREVAQIRAIASLGLAVGLLTLWNAVHIRERWEPGLIKLVSLEQTLETIHTMDPRVASEQPRAA